MFLKAHPKHTMGRWESRILGYTRYNTRIFYTFYLFESVTRHGRNEASFADGRRSLEPKRPTAMADPDYTRAIIICAAFLAIK